MTASPACAARFAATWRCSRSLGCASAGLPSSCFSPLMSRIWRHFSLPCRPEFRPADGRGVQPARPRRWDRRRGDPVWWAAGQGDGRGRSRHGGCRRPRSARGASCAESRLGRSRVPDRHPRHRGRCGPHECRRLWRRDQGPAGVGRGARPRRYAAPARHHGPGLHLSAQRPAAGFHRRPRRLPRHAGRPRIDPRPMEAIRAEREAAQPLRVATGGSTFKIHRAERLGS